VLQTSGFEKNQTAGKQPGFGIAINQYVLRLADAYLIYAEATLGAGTSTSDSKAIQYFNAIRNRAGLPALSSITFTDILNERRVEFGMESSFWFDVKRYYYRDPSAALAFLNGQERETSGTTGNLRHRKARIRPTAGLRSLFR